MDFGFAIDIGLKLDLGRKILNLEARYEGGITEIDPDVNNKSNSGFIFTTGIAF